jgi:hypothetical protein
MEHQIPQLGGQGMAVVREIWTDRQEQHYQRRIGRLLQK